MGKINTHKAILRCSWGLLLIGVNLGCVSLSQQIFQKSNFVGIHLQICTHIFSVLFGPMAGCTSGCSAAPSVHSLRLHR